VLNNEEIVHIVASKPTHATIVDVVVEFTIGVQRLKYPTSKVDDYVVVCLLRSHGFSNF
jgi:hypothetical protein